MDTKLSLLQSDTFSKCVADVLDYRKDTFTVYKINYLASSTLAIYLIHSQPVILNVIGKAIPVLKDWSFDNVSFYF